VNSLAPTSHVRLATIQVLALATLLEVESILPEEASTISGTMAFRPHATCAHHCPFLSSVRALVPEEHTSMATTLEHLKSHKVPTTAKLLVGLSIAPAM
jgi:hypothetical protein